MKFKRRVKIEKGMVDLTPLVNVFFLLFIFFLFTSSFIFQPGIKVSLPKALTREVIQQEGVVITITGDDQVSLNEREITADEIATVAEFFSFGTNDLTQTTLGVSRDDAATFLIPYVD